MALRTDFTTRNVVDPAAQLSNVLSGLQGQLSNYEKQKLAEQEAESLKLHRAGQSRRADEAAKRAERSLSLQEQAARRAVEQDRLLGQALLNVDPTMTGTSVVPATAKEEVTPGVLTTGEQEGIAAGRSNLENILAGLEAEQAAANVAAKAGKTPTGSRRLAAERRGEVFKEELSPFMKQGLGQEAPLMQPVYDAAGRKVAEAGDILGSIFTDHEVPTSAPTPSVAQPKPVAADTTLPLTDRITAVKNDIKLYDQTATKAQADVAKDRAVTSLIDIPATTEEKKLTKAEWLARERQKVKGKGLGGATLSKYLKEVDTMGEVLYPKGEKITGTISITSPDGKRSTSIPYARAQQFIDAGWKIGKSTKDGKSSGDKIGKFAADMFTAFPEDPDAVDAYMKKHEKELKTMSKDALKAHVAELKARVGQESAFDITNILPPALGGGTSTRDVLLP
jgi:hypothetical protein